MLHFKHVMAIVLYGYSYTVIGKSSQKESLCTLDDTSAIATIAEGRASACQCSIPYLYSQISSWEFFSAFGNILEI